MLIAKQLTKQYGSLQVLKGVNLQINNGEVVSIVGSSGAGKSTLLHILGTLDTFDSGSIILNNQPIEKLSGNALAAYRNRHMGFVFQFHHLLPEFNALENVCIPGWIAKRSNKEVKDAATSLLKMLGLGDRLENKPQQLSGGEQQRVAIARALINKPSIVFADEPTGNLDSKHANELHQLFFDLRKETGQTFLIVTHNEDLATLCDRTLVMRDGVIVTEEIKEVSPEDSPLL